MRMKFLSILILISFGFNYIEAKLPDNERILSKHLIRTILDNDLFRKRKIHKNYLKRKSFKKSDYSKYSDILKNKLQNNTSKTRWGLSSLKCFTFKDDITVEKCEIRIGLEWCEEVLEIGPAVKIEDQNLCEDASAFSLFVLLKGGKIIEVYESGWAG